LSIGIRRRTEDVLEICEHIELACAELYHYFADLFKNERGDMLLWLKTAMEEENHAMQFTLIAKLKRQKIISSIQIDPVDAEITLIYIRSLIEKSKKTPPTQKEALQLAINLENKMAALHIENVITFVDPSYEITFLAISQSDRKHLESLQEAYDRL
jgi:rubrerythrin